MNSKLFITVIIIVLIILLAAWYFYSNFYQQPQQGYNLQTSSDTTKNVSNDLNQIPDDSSVNSEVDSLNQTVQSF